MLHALLRIRAIFNSSSAGDFRYLFNQLYVDAYALWIQSTKEDGLSDTVLSRLRDNLAQVLSDGVKKEEVGLDLDLLETQAEVQMMDVEQV